MIFNVHPVEDKFVNRVYNNGMKKFNEFFNLNVKKEILFKNSDIIEVKNYKKCLELIK